jgi:hypothetical protein
MVRAAIPKARGDAVHGRDMALRRPGASVSPEVSSTVGLVATRSMSLRRPDLRQRGLEAHRAGAFLVHTDLDHTAVGNVD